MQERRERKRTRIGQHQYMQTGFLVMIGILTIKAGNMKLPVLPKNYEFNCNKIVYHQKDKKLEEKQ